MADCCVAGYCHSCAGDLCRNFNTRTIIQIENDDAVEMEESRGIVDTK